MAPTRYSDHVRILEFYKMNVPKSRHQAKTDAEKIIGTKLCRCIKSVTKSMSRKPTIRGRTRAQTKKNNELASIGICRSAVLQRKGVSNYRFTCKKKYSLLPGKNGDFLKKVGRWRKTQSKTRRKNR